MSTRINRITLLPLLLIAFLLVACSTPKYYSDDFEKDSFRSHLSSKSHLFEDVAPILNIKRNKGDIDIPLWQVRELDIDLAYDSRIDDLVIMDLHAIDVNGNYGLIDERCYNDISIEWWPESDGTVYVDEVFILGEAGFYIFRIAETIN